MFFFTFKFSLEIETFTNVKFIAALSKVFLVSVDSCLEYKGSQSSRELCL